MNMLALVANWIETDLKERGNERDGQSHFLWLHTSVAVYFLTQSISPVTLTPRDL